MTEEGRQFVALCMIVMAGCGVGLVAIMAIKAIRQWRGAK